MKLLTTLAIAIICSICLVACGVPKVNNAQKTTTTTSKKTTVETLTSTKLLAPSSTVPADPQPQLQGTWKVTKIIEADTQGNIVSVSYSWDEDLLYIEFPSRGHITLMEGSSKNNTVKAQDGVLEFSDLTAVSGTKKPFFTFYNGAMGLSVQALSANNVTLGIIFEDGSMGVVDAVRYNY